MYRIEVIGSLKGLTWSSGHYVPDNEKCKNFHGHDYSLDVIIDSEDVEKSGMAIDFTIVKKSIKPVIEGMDHKFMVPESDIRQNSNPNFIDIYVEDNYRGTMSKNDIFVFPYPTDTAEFIAKYCYKEIFSRLLHIMHQFKLRVIIHEGPGNTAAYWEK
ncbi:MAG TPA: 6-carboxytetrahydropterin synthase [Ferroplasma sp.]|nr:6-carboxytetrahydropterin synthase [Ferroplasma sp.]